MVPQSHRIKVQGLVQGVGFRPFIYRLAKDAGFVGTVMNTGEGVIIQVECSPAKLTVFVESIKKQHPPLAKISSIECSSSSKSLDFSKFSIQKSTYSTELEALVPQDTALCPDCLKELRDPKNRRYGYPFINCTNCGPRFSIIESLPYDRPNTSMKSFSLCKPCSQEYYDPTDRRFHAQPIGCWSCGPSLNWHGADGEKIEKLDCIKETMKALLQGKIVAIKGLGGFHLAVDATNEKAISVLRQRKNRKSKPLAIMVKDLFTAHKYATIDKQEEGLLCSIKSPIVLLKKKTLIDLPENLAPGIAEIGIMLPYTPLHHLLFSGHIKALVMTSGNRSSEPICIDNDDALLKLANITDFFLLHNREIVTRIDDSVLRVVAGKARMLRRSRGYVPEPITLPKGTGRFIACGAGLKNTFCLTREKDAFVSQHIGDLHSPDALDFYEKSINHLKQVHEIKPEGVICDLHPDYLSSRYGKDLGLPLLKVQHHHAHAAAVIAEHHLAEPVFGVIFDGTGLGPDKTIWGGEILFLENNSYQRVAHIDQILLPGGDAAAKEPWRIALAMLWKIHGKEGLTAAIAAQHLPVIPPSDVSFVLQMIKSGVNCPKTSSCGRLFDGIAAFINQRIEVDYEGQAAMELEALAWDAIGEKDLFYIVQDHPTYDPKTTVNDSCQVLDSHFLIESILFDKQQGVAQETIALKFHLWLIKSVAKILKSLTSKISRIPIVLSGGCMQNRLLLEGLFSELTKQKFSVYAGENIPMNDGGISFGQAAIGGGTHVSCNTHEGR